MKGRNHTSARRFRRGIELGKEKYAGSWAEYLWHRLHAVDFMNQAMLLAATLLLCAVPFLLVAAALAGRSVVLELSWRLGLVVGWISSAAGWGPPCAVTTGAFCMGMLAVFFAVFSGMVISYDQKYGPIGIVFGLMSFFIAIGVVLILGAAVGLMWQDRSPLPQCGFLRCVREAAGLRRSGSRWRRSGSGCWPGRRCGPGR
jgi:uncharacterized BrkB/YihY/UPF0761 family membrane protein